MTEPEPIKIGDIVEYKRDPIERYKVKYITKDDPFLFDGVWGRPICDPNGVGEWWLGQTEDLTVVSSG